MRWQVVVPGVVLVILIGVLGFGLTRQPSIIPSALIGKAAPAFDLPTLESDQRVSSAALQGHVSLVNVWASWCIACRAENSLVAEISQRTGVPVVGLNYKDTRAGAKRWLSVFGDPFAVIAFDQTGQTGIDWGVSGVPETYVVDQKGVIRYKVVGPISDQEMREHLIPTLKQLQNAS